MQTIKITTHWTADQAVYVCEFLDELKQAIMWTYSDEIEVMEKMERAFQEEQQAKKAEPGDWFDDEIPF